MSNNLKAHIALFFVSVIYAGNYTIAKEVMPTYLTPEAIVFTRILTGAVVFSLLTIFKTERVEKADFGRLILCGLLGAALNMLVFFKGLNLTTPINASLILLLVPIIVLVVSAIFLKERITNIKIIGIITGVIGAVILVVNNRTISLDSSGFIGDLLVCVNSISYSIYLVLVRKMMLKYNTLIVLKWVFIFGFLFVFPFTFLDFLNSDWSNIPFNIWLALLYILLGVTILTYLFNAYALRFVNTSVVSIYIYLQPLIASIIALSFGKDTLSIEKLTAYVLIFSGVLMVSQSKTWWKEKFQFKN